MCSVDFASNAASIAYGGDGKAVFDAFLVQLFGEIRLIVQKRFGKVFID